ncbi:Oxidoreductase, FAD-binding [Candidatus Paraburkholderia calva]|nr:Oxidoreductase, FAD-binding [Candidatus Paraburkholderia calva]
MGRQSAQLIGKRALRDYVEIGTIGRYVSALRRHLMLAGKTTLAHDTEAGYSPVDIVERGGIRKIGAFAALDHYAPLTLADASADLMSCFIGLHHMAPGWRVPAART